MKAYLVQHGKAIDEKEDPRRPLSKEGIAETKKMAELAAASGAIKPALIFHSGKLRAKQTADIFEKSLNPPKGELELDSIAPLDDILRAIEVITSEPEDIMIVGHLPHLSKVVSKLVAGDEEKLIAAFRNSGIICVEKQGDGKWLVVPAVSY